MSGAAGPDPYLDPASGVLRNRLGITDAGELAQAEAALSASRIVDLERRRLPGRYDLAHLRAFHRLILGDVYDWAGELRTVSIAKGSVFCLPQHLESYGADIFSRLAAADWLRGLAREEFITRLAEFLADVNALHPFREGNGRTQRAFFSQLAHDAGHHIDWVRMEPARNVTASAAAHRGDLAPLRAMLGQLVDLAPPGRTIRADRRPCRLIPSPPRPSFASGNRTRASDHGHKARHCRRWTGATGMLTRSRDEARPCRRGQPAGSGSAWASVKSRRITATDGVAGPYGAEALPRLRLTPIAERSQLGDGTARKAA